MSDPRRDLYRKAVRRPEQLGLQYIPFVEAAPESLDASTLPQIFTGRDKELERVFNLFSSPERRRILVSGWVGIGKSAFILELLNILRQEEPTLLTAYTTLKPQQDLTTAALYALMKAMPNDDWVQRQLNQIGAPTAQTVREQSRKAGGSMIFSAEMSEKDVAVGAFKDASLSYEILLDRALKQYPRGVVIAIDDLDKQDPDRVRQLLLDAQSLLKGRAWFVLTGHPFGVTGDLVTTERGLFDLILPLKQLDPETTYQMLINYLNSARIEVASSDPDDPRSVLPFLPATARELCAVSGGYPRRFNRLGLAVLNTAMELQASQITPDVLQQGLAIARRTLEEQAALSVKEQMVLTLLRERGGFSDEAITREDLLQLGFRTFIELQPILDKLDQADLAQRRISTEATTVYEPLELPSEEMTE